MLRLAVLILVLANAGYYAWSNGMLRDMGWGPTIQAEPQRLEQQVDPDKLRVTPMATSPAPASSSPAPSSVVAASAAASAASAENVTASAPVATSAASSASAVSSTASSAHSTAPSGPVRTVCLQAGSFDEHQTQTLRAALQGAGLPANGWKFEPTNISGRWMVYMGKLADDEAVTKKRNELRALQIDYDRPGPSFEPGLSLGRFSTEEAAQRALSQLTNKGVRTAKVVVERKETTTYILRLPAVDDVTRGKLTGIKSALGGKPLQSCQ